MKGRDEPRGGRVRKRGLVISIIVDNYKRSYFLPFLIQAYTEKERPPCGVEMLIVDDDSGDSFEEFLRLALEDIRPWFEVRAFQTHKVVTYNQCLPVNCMVKRARGEILILNHSDVFPCTHTALKRVWNKQKEKGRFLIPRFIFNICSHREWGGPLINGASMPKGFFEAVRGFDERFYGSPSEDIDLMNRLKRKFGVETDREILFIHSYPLTNVGRRMNQAPWKPGLGIGESGFNYKWLDARNNRLVNENGARSPDAVNPDGWGELDTLEEISL